MGFLIHASSTHIIDCSAGTRCAESVAITISHFYGNEEPMDKCRPAGNTETCGSLFCKLCFLFLSLPLLPIGRDTSEIVMCISCRSFFPFHFTRVILTPWALGALSGPFAQPQEASGRGACSTDQTGQQNSGSLLPALWRLLL